MEAKARTIIRVIVVCERLDGELTQQFDLAPEEVFVIAPLIEAMRLLRPPEGDRRA